MIRDITIGQYYPTESLIHRLDPRVKLFGTILYIISLFVATNPAVYMMATVFLFVCIGISKVPLKFMLRGLRSIFLILLLSVSFNLFMVSGNVLVKLGPLQITDAGIIQGEIIADVWKNGDYDKNKDGIMQYVMLKGEPDNPEAVARTDYSLKTINETEINVKLEIESVMLVEIGITMLSGSKPLL